MGRKARPCVALFDRAQLKQGRVDRAVRIVRNSSDLFQARWDCAIPTVRVPVIEILFPRVRWFLNCRPKLGNLRNQIQENVKSVMSSSLQFKSAPSIPNSRFSPTKPNFIASCSAFGSQGAGLIVRVAAMTTESVYQFLRLQLGSLEPFVGAFPYS
ncbi:hypothetical protein KSS87_000401 [Heliosperma pusillum]|nr:hypothetical protein KSS87_000401 [Heliosperma pusillum]